MRAVLSISLGCLCLVAGSSVGHTRELAIRIDSPPCLPNLGNAPLTVQLDDDEGVAAVRLYFRRLHPLGSFYFTPLHRSGPGLYSGVFPRPDDRAPAPMQDSWWRELKNRPWLAERDREWLEGWLRRSRHEPAEFFLAVHDAQGERLAETEIQTIGVLEAADCSFNLSDQESEWTTALVIGETTELQAGRSLFHWSCGGIVERISAAGERSPDRVCADAPGQR